MSKKTVSEIEKLMTPCADREHLHLWIHRYTGLDFPNKTISRYSKCNPLEFIWIVYQHIMEGKPGGFLGLAGRDSLKCVKKGTLILTDQALKPIEEIRVGDRVWDGANFQSVLKTFDEGKKESYEVVTSLGYRLSGSKKHRIQILTERGVEWKKIKDLSEEDHAIISIPQTEIKFDRDEFDFGYFLGMLIGDGGLSLMDRYNLVSFSNIDPVLISFYKDYCAKLGITNIRYDKRCSYSFTNKAGCNTLKSFGLKCGYSIHKSVPAGALKSRSTMLGFLNGFFDTDGTYSKSKKQMLFCQSNPKILNEIQFILAALGVASSHRKTAEINGAQDAYRIEVNGAGIKRLLDLGFRSRCSVGPKKDLSSYRSIKPTQFAPIPSSYVLPWAKKIDGIRKHGFRSKFIKVHNLKKYKAISREKLIQQREALIELKKIKPTIYQKYENPEWLSFDLADIPEWVMNLENICVDKVVSVSKQRDYFYDLEVEKSHAYWSNGFISHNTLGLSVIDLLSFLHDSRNTVHIAMTTAQGGRARAYLESFVNKNPLIREAVIKQNTRELTLMIDDKQVGMELLPATPKAVQGAHCSLLTFDEVASSMEPQNVKAYKDAHGILGSSHKGKPAVVVKITSRQAGYSLAEQEIRNASKSGLHVLNWTTLDATEYCPDERSGTISTPLWVDVLKGEKYTDQEYQNLHDTKKLSFTLTTDTFDRCRQCAIAAFCQGDLKKQTSKSKLLRTIDDVINKIQLAGSWDWAVAQLMSLKPSTEGLVYFEYDRQIHVPGWNKMWEVLTGDQPQFEITRDKFVEELKKRGANFYAGIDWGWSSPSTCVVIAVDSREMIYVVEAMGRTYMSDPDFIQLIKTTLHKKYDIQMYCPDLANGSGNSLLRQAGLPTTDEVDKTSGSVNRGINVIKGLLRVPGSNGMARLFLAPDLPQPAPGIAGILEEFELYHKKQDASGKILDNDDPAPENDHFLDAARYLIVWLFGRMRMKVGTDYEKKRRNPNQSSNIPGIEEISRQFGFQYNDNRSAEEKEDEDLDGGSGPIFTWT